MFNAKFNYKKKYVYIDFPNIHSSVESLFCTLAPKPEIYFSIQNYRMKCFCRLYCKGL